MCWIVYVSRETLHVDHGKLIVLYVVAKLSTEGYLGTWVRETGMGDSIDRVMMSLRVPETFYVVSVIYMAKFLTEGCLV